MMTSKTIEITIKLPQRRHEDEQVTTWNQGVGDVGNRPIVILDMFNDIAAHDRIDTTRSKMRSGTRPSRYQQERSCRPDICPREASTLAGSMSTPR